MRGKPSYKYPRWLAMIVSAVLVLLCVLFAWLRM
jgi:hypothetical protein